MLEAKAECPDCGGGGFLFAPYRSCPRCQASGKIDFPLDQFEIRSHDTISGLEKTKFIRWKPDYVAKRYVQVRPPTKEKS